MSLIDTFKEQDRVSIQDTLTALAEDSNVFSVSLPSDHLPFLEGHEYYVYMQDDEVVFLLRDEHRTCIKILAEFNNSFYTSIIF